MLLAMPPHEAQSRITADRDELKYLLPAAAAPELARCIARFIPPHHHRERDGVEPVGQSCATTVYFDTEQRELYRAALRDPVHVKVRAREYYLASLEPPYRSLAATGEPRSVWLELKTRDGSRSRKRRVRVAEHEVESWFVPGERVRTEAGERSRDRERSELAEELLQLRVRLGAALAPSCIVSYRRASFQDESASLRVTLDRDLCVFAPRAGLWRERGVLSRESLGVPVLEESRCVLEIKSHGARPAWFGELLPRFGASELLHGKFALASHAVHGPLP